MISLIVAMDENNLIGIDNKLPWRLPSDMSFFKKKTLNRNVLMGLNTFNSIGKPLKSRNNIILTNKIIKINGCIVLNNLKELRKYEQQNELFVIGGLTVYNQLIHSCQRIYLTRIHYYFKGNIYFNINLKDFKIKSIKKVDKDSINRYDHSFIIYERI